MSQDDMLTRILERLLEAAAAYALPSIPSRTLQDSLEQIVDVNTVLSGYAVAEGRLYLDPYWAVYVHDGRNSIAKAPLIWFDNPTDDPRLVPNGVISRVDEFRSLTKQEFSYWMRRNREAWANGLKGPMNVVWGGVKNVVGSYFFDNNIGMAGFQPIAEQIVSEEFRNYLEEAVPELFEYVEDPATAFIG